MKPFNPTSPTLTTCDRVWLEHAASGRRASFAIRENRRHKGFFLLAFDGIDSLNDLEPWLGSIVEADAESVPALAESEVYHFEVVGLVVRTRDGEVLGEITEVMDLPAQDVWVIHGTAPGGGRREILLPVADHVVLEVDLAQRFAVVDPPLGLVDP